jgi:hypothetical protein
MALGGVGVAATCRPAWYVPVPIDYNRLHDDKRDLADLLDRIGAALNSGRSARFELRQDQANRWLAARDEIWPEAAGDFSSFRDFAVFFLDDQVRVAGRFERGRIHTLVSLSGRVRVSDDDVQIACQRVQLGALPVPAGWLARALSANARTSDGGFELRDGVVSFRNTLVWPNGKRRCRLREFTVREGLITVELEPLRSWP